MQYVINNFAWEIPMIKIKLDLVANWTVFSSYTSLNSDIALTQIFLDDKNKLSFFKRIRITRLLKKANKIYSKPVTKTRNDKLCEIVLKILAIIMSGQSSDKGTQQ